MAEFIRRLISMAVHVMGNGARRDVNDAVPRDTQTITGSGGNDETIEPARAVCEATCARSIGGATEFTRRGRFRIVRKIRRMPPIFEEFA